MYRRIVRWSVADSCIPMIEVETASDAASHTCWPKTVRQNSPAMQDTAMPPKMLRGCATGREGIPAHSKHMAMLSAQMQHTLLVRLVSW